MIDVSGTPGFSRYIDAKINCATVDAIESINNLLYHAKRSLIQTLPTRTTREDEMVWFHNKNLNKLAAKCSIVPSLAIVIQYERNNKDDNPNNARGHNVRFV